MTSPTKQPTDTLRRVVRGGTWDYPTASVVRAAYRNDCAPSIRSYRIGFRCSQRGCRQQVLKSG